MGYNRTITTPDEFLKDHYGQSLCIRFGLVSLLLTLSGTGLFLIANSTNHSCDPNLVATSATNNYMYPICFSDLFVTIRVTMIALKDIKKDEELTISYIDTAMHYTERCVFQQHVLSLVFSLRGKIS